MLVGLLIGGLSFWLLPRRAANGQVLLILIGIAGAMLAGFLARAIASLPAGAGQAYLAAAAGAVIALLLYQLLLRARSNS